jgi:hypothetical protein
MTDKKPHTIISEDEIILRDTDDNELIFGYDSAFHVVCEHVREDKDDEIFYLEIKKSDDEENGIGIALTIDQLRNFIYTSQKLIRKLELDND